ncbi:unnamed protein product [Rotaria socialis]
MYQIEEHLAPLPGVITNSLLDESSSDNDSSVEVMSIVDENEYELIKWTNYLQLNSDSDDDSDDNYSSTQPALLVNYSSSESSSDEEQIQNAATLAAEQDKIILNEKNKQLKLTDLWKK